LGALSPGVTLTSDGCSSLNAGDLSLVSLTRPVVACHLHTPVSKWDTAAVNVGREIRGLPWEQGESLKPAVIVGITVVCAVTGFVGFAAAAGQAPRASVSSSTQPVFEGPVSPAQCGPGSMPQDGLDGEVPLADRLDGRSSRGYSCNLKPIGQYQGEGASWVSQSYGKCAYMSTRWPNTEASPGVQVINVSDPSHPTLAGTLTSPAMLGPWESLKVNAKRGLLAAAFGGPIIGDGAFDVYDIKTNCLEPKLLGSVSATDVFGQVLGLLNGGLNGLANLPSDFGPQALLGHEGNWSPDGDTYWVSGLGFDWLTAIDVSNPAQPRVVWAGSSGVVDHGFSLSDNGDTLYMAQVGNTAEAFTGIAPSAVDENLDPNGLAIFNVSDIQSRKPNPAIQEIGHVYWTDGAVGQMSIPISYGNHPYLVFVDEADEGGVRIIDIANPQQPRVVSKLKLQIQMPQNLAVAQRDVKGSGFFTYDSHYCTVDREENPTTLACGYFDSGIRVFDIRNPLTPAEIAYYNPSAQLGKNDELKGSEHAGGPVMVGLKDAENGGDIGAPRLQAATGPPTLNVDWCSSPPAFVGDQLWVTCQDNGFMVLKFTNGVYPVTANCPVATGKLSGTTLGLVRLGMTRKLARYEYDHVSDRAKHFEDFFCLTPIGVRVGYASTALLHTLSRRERKQFKGRVVWASTSNAFYAVRGVRPGTTLAAAGKHLKLTGPFHIGLNYWYLATNGTSTAVLKVRHGTVEEIGIGDKSLTRVHKAQVRFLMSFS
jgi:hypothetical protein